MIFMEKQDVPPIQDRLKADISKLEASQVATACFSSLRLLFGLVFQRTLSSLCLCPKKLGQSILG